MVDLMEIIYMYIVVVFELIFVVFFLVDFLVYVDIIDVGLCFYVRLIEKVIVVCCDDSWLCFFDMEEELFEN